MAETIQTDAVADSIISAVPSGSTSKGKQATVVDEEEELKAEVTEGIIGDGDVEMKDKDAKEVDEEEEDPNKIPDNACETLYLQNLNEKVRIPIMKDTLYNLLKVYKFVPPIVAHRNVRMRGQAFVTFPDKEIANRVRREVNEFPLYGKPMQITFARTRSDVAVKRIEGDDRLEEFKKERLETKKATRRNNPLRQKAQSKLKADESGQAPSKRQKFQMPDEYLPANKVLFIQNLPEGTTSDDLREVFELHAGLLEIRTIPAKKDIAFIEFVDEATSSIARDALHNFKIDGETKMKVTFARR